MPTLFNNNAIGFAASRISDRGLNKAWLFSVFVILALVKPFDIENGNRYVGMVLVLLVTAASVCTLYHKNRWREVWDNYGLEASLLVGLSLIYMVSLAVHLDQYPTWLDVVIFGTPEITLLAMFGMAWLIFRYRNPYENVWPAMVVLVLLNGIAVLQAFNYDLVAPFMSWFVASDYGRPNVSSLFRINTIYGITAALIVVYGAGELIFKTWALKPRILLVLLVLLAFIGGGLSESRSFFPTLVVGLLVLAIYSFARSPKATLVGLTVAVIGFHTVVWSQPRVAKDYGRIIPYIGKFDRLTEIGWKDFIPVISNRAFENRINHWRRAYAAWRESPWLGIGPGVFRMKDLSVTGKKSVTNPHNIFLQTIVDSGAIGLVLLIVLLGRLIQRIRDPVTMAILLGLLAGHMFENLFDKSMAFVLVAAWLLSEPSVRSDSLASTRL